MIRTNRHVRFGLAFFVLSWNLFFETQLYVSGSSIEWVEAIATETGNEYAQRSATDSQGNLFVTGYSNGPTLFGSTNSGDYDIFTAKYTKDGTLVWGRYFGTSKRDQSFSIAVDSLGHPVISGFTQGNLTSQSSGGSDIFITKFDKNNGTTLVSRLFGGPRDEYSYGVDIDLTDNSILVSGFTTGNLTSGLNQGLEDSFVVKFDTNGVFKWVQMFGTNGSDKANGLAVDPNRNIFVTGTVTSGAFDVGYGNRDSWVIKLNYTGDMQWVHQFGSNDSDTFYSIDYDSSHNVISCGQVKGDFFNNSWSGEADAACIAFDQAGNRLWASVVGTADYDSALTVNVGRSFNNPTPGNNLNDSIFVSGFSDGNFYPFTNNGSDDMMIFLLNSTGHQTWIYMLGSRDDDEACGVSYFVPSGQLYVVGYIGDSVTGLVNSTGGFDAVVFMMSPPFDNNEHPSDNGGNSKGSSVDTAVVVGSVLGSVLGLILLAGIVGAVFFVSRRKQNMKMLAMFNSVEPEYSQASLSGQTLPPDYGSIGSVNSQGSSESSKKPKDSSWEINYGDLVLEKKIGQGASGIVYRGKWRKQEVACKQLLINKASDKDVQNFRAEAELMRNLRPNKNVLLYYGICTNPMNPLCIVTEYVPNGNLWHLLQNPNFQWTNALRLKIIKGVANGMFHLAKEKIVHRDLAARNILLTENYDAKISDFGLSRVVENEDDSNQTATNVGPIRWMSPEAIMNRVYSEKSDVWSFAVLVYEVLTKSQPYPGVSQLQVATQVGNKLLRLDYPKDLPVISALLERCLAWDPENRPRFEEIAEMLEKVTVNEQDQIVSQ